MAEIFVDEGLDKILGIFPKNGSNLTQLYVGLFTSQTPTTVPARTATGGAAPSGWTEVTGTNYARQSLAAGGWGAPGTNGNGRKITASSQISFPAAGAGGWTVANGFFLATNSASGAGDTIIFFANFDSGLARTLAVGDQLKLTPSMEFDG